MITLTIYPASFGEPSASPFCVKSLCMLSAAGLDYEINETADPRKAPKGKLPVIVHDANTIADSEQIRAHIEAASGVDFDEGLSVTERAVSHAIIRMAEENIYFAIVTDRWKNDANWAHLKAEFFTDVPWIIRGVVTGHIRKQAIAQVDGQGIGLHSEEERLERITRDVAAIRDLLGDKPFLFGDHPTAADYSVVPMLRASLVTPVPVPLSDYIRGDAVLMAYLERGKQALYPG